MDGQELMQLLNLLIRLDADTVSVYEQAIEEMDTASLRERLTTFRQDHERHVLELSAVVRQLGGAPPEAKKAAGATFIDGFTPIRRRMGAGCALQALSRNEQLALAEYQGARNRLVTGPAEAIVDRNFKDERRHFDYIVCSLRERK
jgi:uncharacterized protein (TIGR02284 family)